MKPLLAALLGASLAFAASHEVLAAVARGDTPQAEAVVVPPVAPPVKAEDAETAYATAQRLLHGQGVARDPAQAAHYFRIAADRGHLAARTMLGDMLLEGLGLPKDEPAGLAMLRQAAKDGSEGAMYYLGEASRHGRGVPLSAKEGAVWFTQAVDLGNAFAAEALAGMLMRGEGDLPADPAQAAACLRIAALQGLVSAQRNLGLAYGQGVGVPQNQEEAYRWLSLAAARSPVGDKVFGERDAAAARLTPEQLSHAQAAAAQFHPLPAALLRSGLTGKAVPDAALYGTGFFVSSDGAALTNAHVVKDCRAVSVATRTAAGLKATIVARDETNDLALLKVDTVPPSVAGFRADPAIRVGEGVVTIGYPLKGALSSQPVVTTGAVNALSGLHDDARYLQISAPLQQGNSGGPLLDLSGNVVGVSSSKLNALSLAMATGDMPQNVNFAIKAEVARAFLKEQGAEGIPVPSLAREEPADVAEQARGFVIAVECLR